MSKFRTLSAALAITASAVLTVGVATAPAEAAGTKLTATPKTRLHAGNTITVKGSGYLANTTIYIVECASKSVATCDTSHLKTVQTNSKGAFTLRYAVFTGAACKVHKSCFVAGGDAAQVRSAAVKVTFA